MQKNVGVMSNHNKIKDMNKEIETSAGIVENIDGKWVITPNSNSSDISFQSFTDRNPYDCAVIRHGSKYGFFYVSDMTSTYYGNTNPTLICFDKDDPFPYDEIVIKSMAIHEIMIVGYRIGDKWGLDNISFDVQNGTLCRFSLISCCCSSLLEAESKCLVWKKPFEDNKKYILCYEDGSETGSYITKKHDLTHGSEELFDARIFSEEEMENIRKEIDEDDYMIWNISWDSEPFLIVLAGAAANEYLLNDDEYLDDEGTDVISNYIKENYKAIMDSLIDNCSGGTFGDLVESIVEQIDLSDLNDVDL